MSLNKKAIFGIGGGAVGVAVAVALIITPVVGADFSATDTGSANVQMATLTIDLGDDAHGMEGTFHLNSENLAPGDTQAQRFYVKNTGSIPATVSLKRTGYGAAPQLTGADWQELKFGVQGHHPAMVPSNGALVADLGVLQPGEQRAYKLLTSLDSSATDEWQGVSYGSTITITLKQQ